MTTEVLAATLVGGQQYTFGQGRIWYLKTATSPLSITAEQSGSGSKIRKFINVAAGFKFIAPEGDGWLFLRVNSPLSQNIEMILGDDDVSVANAVTVSGSVVTQAQPSTAIAVSAADSVIANTAALAIAANVARRRITVGSLSTNVGSVRVQSAGAGANKGLELQPGTFMELDTTAAFDVRNDSGAAVTVYVFEES
jgi:hypothetical protein